MKKIIKTISAKRLQQQKKSRLSIFFSVIALFLLVQFNVMANEEALYDPVAPPGSAFIRIFNNDQSSELSATIGEKPLKAKDACSASEYHFVPAGNYELEIKGIRRMLNLEADHYYTAYLDALGEIAFIEGRPFNQRKKALIAFYNLIENASLALMTANGKVSVIKPVDFNGIGFREVNAVKINLSAYQGTEKIVDAKSILLKRGKVFSLFACGSLNNRPTLVWVGE